MVDMKAVVAVEIAPVAPMLCNVLVQTQPWDIAEASQDSAAMSTESEL